MKRGTPAGVPLFMYPLWEYGNGNSGESEGFVDSSENSRANSLAKGDW